ncbi:hypothetical protein ZWY2020_057512 [Hordeum vulgare]|nr:hypothetical protein ZWY2020_057512 [Hordeum vulgare]
MQDTDEPSPLHERFVHIKQNIILNIRVGTCKFTWNSIKRPHIGRYGGLIWHKFCYSKWLHYLNPVYYSKDVAISKRKLSTLQRYLGGIKYMTRLPDIVIVLDQIPTISLVDTNCDRISRIYRFDSDDTMSSIRLILNKLVFSICEGRLH